MEIETAMKMIKAEAEAALSPDDEDKEINPFLLDAKIFAAVVESGSMTGAGNLMGKSQSAVSRKLARWERDLGFPLFGRRGRGVTPTPKAIELYKLLRETLDKVEDIKGHTSSAISLPPPPPRPIKYPPLPDDLPRNEEVFERYCYGATTLAELAEMYGMSRQRVHQIVIKEMGRRAALERSKKAIEAASSIDDLSIDHLLLSVRSYNALVSEGIKTVGELIKTDDCPLLRIPNFGRQSLAEVRSKVTEIMQTRTRLHHGN